MNPLLFCTANFRPATAWGHVQKLLTAAGLLAGLAGPGRALAQGAVGGTVFEDVNYGGGAGRPYLTANTSATTSGFVSGSIRRPNATVELYDNTGAYRSSTATDALGAYLFTGLTAGSYTVRVVSQTVSSSRPGTSGAAGAVQTFRTASGSNDVNRVGGENPAVADSGPNTALVVTSATTGNNISLVFAGQNTVGDNTAFVDNVEVLQNGTALGTNPIVNPSFENGTLTANGGAYQYTPTGTGFGWTFDTQSGIQINNSAFTPPNTGSGARAGFAQNAGTISQAFNLPTGTYVIRFQTADRTYGGQQALNVTVNNFTLLAGLQAAAGTYATYQTAAFTVGPGGAGVGLGSLVAQSVAPVTVDAVPVTGVDFGYSFDVVTNTNDSGQGSLRQFMLNANALTNANLAQAGQVAGRETSIFMIPNGATTSAPAGLRAGLASGLNASTGTNAWAQIAISSSLPALTDAGTTLDAATQTANVQDSNPGQVGLGGTGGQFATVGVGAIAFSQFDRPEVEVYGLRTAANVNVLRVGAANSTVRGFALHGAGYNDGTVRADNVAGLVLENNLIGTTAYAIADPTLSIANSAGTYGIYLSGGTLGATVRHNVVAYASNSGIYVPSGGTATGSDILIVRNELVQNGYRVSGGDNITVGDGGSAGPLRIVYNLIRTANSDGVQFDIGKVAVGGTGRNVLRNNTFFDNGNGGESAAQSQLEGAAVLYLQRSGATTGTNPDSLYLNIVTQTQAGAFVVGYGQRGVIITRNSTYFNGTPFNSPTGGNLGIDLIANPAYSVSAGAGTLGARDYGNGDGVTPNPGTLNTAFANGGINYPVLTLASATGNTSATVNVVGYVGSAPGQAAFAGAVVDFYTADNVQANNSGAVSASNATILPHGEGRTYVGSLTCDNSGNFAGQLSVPAGTPPLTGAAVTGFLTGTAFLAGQGTSEFGPNRAITVAADVQASITGSGATPAGSTGTFTVTFSNQQLSGPVTASGVVAAVELPAGLAGVAVTGGSYDIATGLVTYPAYSSATPGSLASGASFASTITYTQPVAAPVTAAATISTTTNEDSQTANNSATATNTTVLLYDVTTAVSGPASATAGNQVAYNVTTTNVGGTAYPSPAPQVVQTLTLPAGATNVFVTGGGVLTGSTVTFPTIAALSAGQSLTNTVSFTAPAGVASMQVGATVSTTPADGDLSNNGTPGNNGNNSAPYVAKTTLSAPTGLAANAFASISASVAGAKANIASATPGAAVVFTIAQGNRGPNPATGVNTTVVVPAGLPVAGANAVTINGAGPTSIASGGAANYTGGATYDPATGLVTFPTIGNQPTGAANNASYTIGFNAPLLGVATATVAVQTTSSDNLPADNQATAQVTIAPAAPADLSVALVGPTAATVGQVLAYTLTTNNNGPASATSVGQALSLPAGLLVSTTDANSVQINGALPSAVVSGVATYAGLITYNAATGLLTIPPVASLAPDGVLTTTIGYPAPANGSVSLVLAAAATVTTTSPESNLLNNVAGLTTTLQAAADVQVSLTGVGQIAPGNPVTYGVTALNNGPSPAPAVATTVSLPTGLLISTTDASSVRINNLLPSSVANGVATYILSPTITATYDSRTAAGGSATPGLVTLPSLSNLQPGASGVNTVTFVLPAGYKGTLVSTATAVVTGIADPIPSNNTAVVQPIIAAALGSNDLRVTLAAGAATVTAGQPVSFTLTTNSTGTASGVLQFLQLPPGLTATGGTVTVTSGGNAVLAVYDPISGLLTLPPVLSLGTGGALVYTIAISRAPGSGPLSATASVSGNELDNTNSANNIALASVDITTQTSLSTSVTGPATVPVGTRASYLITAANGGPTTATGAAQTVTVPANATNVQLNGVAITPGSGGVVTLPIPDVLAPGAANTVSNTLSFTAPGAAGSSYSVPASLTATGPGSPAPATASQPTAVSSPAPAARNVVNGLQAPAGNTALPLPIEALSATARGVASIANYTVVALPPASQGVLYVFDGTAPVLLSTANFAGLVLTPAQAGNLRFQPAAGFSGNATFTYLATDNAGTPSNVARYLVPVAPDASSVYTATPSKGGASRYQKNDVLAFVIDNNGALHSAGKLVYNPAGTTATILATGASTGLVNTPNSVVPAPAGSGPAASGPYPANPTNALPAGVSLDQATGLIYVSDASLLAGTKLQYFQINVTTTDIYGGTNLVTAQFNIGAYPLPVELVEFTAQAVKNADARLAWRTASEKNSDHFDVERSLDGAAFVKIGQVQGQGTTAAATAYALTDAGIGPKARGPVYYRLKQVDRDGTFAYSPVRTVLFDKTQTAVAFSIYPNPNPAGASAMLDLTALPAGQYRLSLLDAVGRQVGEFEAAGGLTRGLDVRKLATGTYLLRLTGTAANGTSLSLSQRLIKE